MKDYKLTINGHSYEVSILSRDDKKASVNVNGREYQVLFNSDKEESSSTTEIDTVKKVSISSADATTGQDARNICAPLPGILVEMAVSSGDAIKAGQKIAVLEAMKMENEISADCDGTVGRVFAAKGDSLQEGSPIVEIL